MAKVSYKIGLIYVLFPQNLHDCQVGVDGKGLPGRVYLTLAQPCLTPLAAAGFLGCPAPYY